jgi:hypothetical protein
MLLAPASMRFSKFSSQLLVQRSSIQIGFWGRLKVLVRNTEYKARDIVLDVFWREETADVRGFDLSLGARKDLLERLDTV